MKNFNITLDWESPTFGKYRRIAAIFTLFALFFMGNVSAQGGCSGLTPSFINYEPCKYRVQIVNTSDCFTPTITVLIDANAFETWSANTAGGWTGQELAPNVVQLTHSNPFMPIGTSFPMIFTLPVGITTLGNFNWEYTCFPGESCTIFPGIELTSCPDPMDASIIGVKYRECGSLPYSNQTTISDWTIQLLNVDGNVLGEQVTDAGGNYAFYDLPVGNYIAKETQQPGWTWSVPATGQYTVDLAPSQQTVLNFGNCPGCSCDSIYMDVVQLPVTSDTCAYAMSASNTGAYCFDKFSIAVATGTITLVTPAAGWSVLQPDAQHVELIPPTNYIPIANFQPGVFRITGSANQQITVSTSYTANGVPVVCSRGFSYQCPPPSSPAPCCPAGSTFGTELVKNSDFQLGNQDFTNDYTYFNPGGPTMIGKYSVLNQAQVFPANSQWACTDHTLLGGQMLIVDGYGGPIAWQQTVNVTAGTNYAYSAWFNNLVLPTKNYDDPQMALFVGNTQIAGPLNLPESPDQWVRLCGTWTAMASGPVLLSIRMLATTNVGNDVAIDDVSMRACNKNPCIEDFETGGTGQWASTNGSISSITDPFTGSMVLKGSDNQGASWIYNNSSAYNGDWTQKFNNCLCFDIRYDNGNPSNPGSGTGAITIYQGNDPLNFAKRATFVVNTPIGNTWTRICVPVGLSNGTTYPSNQYGQWTSTSLADFDMVMQGVSGIGIPLDFAGGSNPSEMVFVDNFCVEQCTDSCFCGTWTDISYRPYQGAPNQTAECGDTLVAQCKGLIPWTMSGNFMCQGNACPPTIPMSWMLTKPNGGMVSGPMSGPNFNLSIPASDLNAAGLYHLVLKAICGMDTCYCEFEIQVDNCPCIEDFETGGTGQWTSTNGSISVISDPFSGSMVLKGSDNQGASWMYNNSSAYNGDWTQKFNNCLCFDIRYDNGNPSNPGSGTGAITIYQGNDPLNFAKRATFVVNTPIGNTWTRICVPVGLSNGTTYPSNQYGQWTSTSLADFDMVMQGVSGIGIPLDFAGGSNPSEMVFVDNFCVEQCAGNTCCANSSTFNNLIAQGFTVTTNGCSVTVTTPQFDSCYQFTTPPILDGENVQQVITPATGSWTFNNLENGYHQICVTVFDQCNSQEMCTSVKIDCQPPEVDTSCCAYSMYLVNKYTDIAHIKKVRVSGICGTEICCADPDEWVQVDGSPNYIEWFEDNLTGVPNGDAIDNDFIIYLKRTASPHNLEVEWFDATGVICRHLLELSCDMPYNEDDDWTLNTTTTALNDPNLLVFAARAPEEDDESDCEEAREDRLSTSCDVSYTATCSGGTNYVVSLSGPSGFAKYFWEVIYAPIGVTNPTINSVQNPTFTATEGGYYTVSLVAVTASNDTCTTEGEIEIPIIDPDFDALQQPCGYIGQFVAYGMDAASDVVSWSCPGYPSFPSTGNIVTFDFQGIASVSVTMTIKDKYDCTHEITKQVDIVDCEAGVVVDKYCPDPCSNGTTNVTVHFKNLSKGGKCPVTYTWDYGDGTVSPPSQNPADGETHMYTVLPFTNLGLPCPLPAGGVNYTVTLTMDDGTCTSTATTTLNISQCQANFTYKACPDGRVDFYGDELGTWDFTGSIDIAKWPYSDKKDKQGRQKHVRVRYGQSGTYLVKYTPHCPNGSECELLKEVVVVVDCCTKNQPIKDKAPFSVNSKDYKLKGKFRSTQFVRRHKIVAKTRLRKSVLKIGGHKCWVSSKDFAIIAEFEGKIYGREKADGCNCAFQVDIPGPGFPNHPIYGPWFVRKAKVQEVWHKRKLHPRKDSITSTHTAEITNTQLIQFKLKLGKDCVRFHWWTDWY